MEECQRPVPLGEGGGSVSDNEGGLWTTGIYKYRGRERRKFRDEFAGEKPIGKRRVGYLRP